MATYDLTRLKRLMQIYRLLQVCLVSLFLFVSYNFMLLFAKQGTADYFSSQ